MNFSEVNKVGAWVYGLVLLTQGELIKEANYTKMTNYVGLVGYTILLWDHIITFADEVEYVWKRPFGRFSQNPSTYLFFFNRYFTPIAFIGNLVAYLSSFSEETCRKFVRYEGACIMVAISIAELALLQRVRAVYAASRYRRIIPFSLLALFIVQTFILGWLLFYGMPVPHLAFSADRACTMVYDVNTLDGQHFWPSLSAWFPLVFDTLVILLTLYKCVPQAKVNSASHLFRILVRDGLLYYSVIFGVNLALALMIIVTPPGIQNIAAQLEQLLTVAMISRITLSLRKEGRRRSNVDTMRDKYQEQYPIQDSWHAPPRPPPAHVLPSTIPSFAALRNVTDFLNSRYSSRPVSCGDVITTDETHTTATTDTDVHFKHTISSSSPPEGGSLMGSSWGANVGHSYVDDVEAGVSSKPQIVDDSLHPPGINIMAGTSQWNEPYAYELRAMKPSNKSAV